MDENENEFDGDEEMKCQVLYTVSYGEQSIPTTSA